MQDQVPWLRLDGLIAVILVHACVEAKSYDHVYTSVRDHTLCEVVVFLILRRAHLHWVSVLRQGKAKPVVFRVASRFKNVVQSIRYKRSPYTIRTLARSETLQKALIKQVQRQVAKECKLICSIKGGESVRRYKPPRLLNFKWKLIASELKKKAPTLYMPS